MKKPLLLQNNIADGQTGCARTDWRLVGKSLAIWVLIIPLAIANGFMRDSLLEPLMGKYALPLSGIVLSALVFLLCWFFVPRLGAANQRTYIITGACWVVLAVAFECAMGIFILKASWGELMAAYNPASGNLWVFVLMCIGIFPWLSAKIHARKTLRKHYQAAKNMPG